MTRHSRPLASIGVSCVLSAFVLVAADEPKADPPRVEVRTTVTKPTGSTKVVIPKEVVTTKALITEPVLVRDVMKAAGPGAFNQGVVVRNNVVIQNGVVVQQGVNDQMVQQLMRALRTILRGDYQLVLVVCEPTKDQRREIARAGERALKSAASQVAQWQGNTHRVIIRNGMNVFESVSPPDPRKVIREALADAVKTHLPAEATARYRKEVELKAADEKRAAVRNLVERLDHVLLLSASQREKLADALSSNWNEAWAPSLPTFLVDENSSFLPQVPDQFVVPALSPDQARAWQTTSKMQNNSSRGFIGPLGVDDKPLEDAEPVGPSGDARGPEGKK